MIRKNTIPTILGVLILIIGMFAGIFFLRNMQIFRLGASADAAPKDIRVSNITDNSITISWTTDKPSVGILNWGDSENKTDKIEIEDQSGQKFYNHSISMTGLNPNTNYFYKINSDGSNFDNGGIAWKVTTGAALGINKTSLLLSGNIINASGIAERRALVYANINNYLLSTVTSDTGNYVFQMGSVRTGDLAGYAQIDPASTLIQISVVAPPDGMASAQIFAQSGDPVPVMVIGQVYDFRNQAANNEGENTNAQLNLPENIVTESKFNVEVPSSTPKPTSVILESLNEGETITSTQPQFFGKGPGGESITIEVHSQDPISATVKIPQNGSWNYAVPTNLEPGNHSVTISWIDASGITRFLTRNFVVKAGEVPAFTASQSGATTTPTPTPNSTVAPTSASSGTPQATLKPTATPTPVPSATATTMPVPVTGDLTPTLILFIMGLLVIVFSFTVWKISEN